MLSNPHHRVQFVATHDHEQMKLIPAHCHTSYEWKKELQDHVAHIPRRDQKKKKKGKNKNKKMFVRNIRNSNKNACMWQNHVILGT